MIYICIYIWLVKILVLTLYMKCMSILIYWTNATLSREDDDIFVLSLFIGEGQWKIIWMTKSSTITTIPHK